VTSTETDTLRDAITAAGQRRKAAEDALHAAWVEMKASKDAVRALLEEGIEQGVTKTEMADLLGVTRQTVYNILNDKRSQRGR
jgi:DNA invertase Pin-like site-specific DNA recombinase